MAIDKTTAPDERTKRLHAVVAVAPFEVALVIRHWLKIDAGGLTDADGPQARLGTLQPMAEEDAAAYAERVALGIFQLLKEDH